MNNELRATLHLPFTESLQKVKEAFQAEGFGNVSEMDVRKTLKDKINQEFEPYTILGMCNPNFAYRALKVEHEIGLMLPCTVLVHECEGATKVVAQDPGIMVQVLPNVEMEPIANEVRDKIMHAMKRLYS